MSFLDWMYEPDQRDRDIFGEIYNPPHKFRHGKWEEIARLEQPEDSDGNPVTIYECRYPARFFKLVVHPSQNSIGEPSQGYEITTGSGNEMGALAVQLARQIADGMIGFHHTEASK